MSEIPCGICHLALAELSEQHILYREISTPWADDIFLENGVCSVIGESDDPDFTVEFPATSLAFEVNHHIIACLFISISPLPPSFPGFGIEFLGLIRGNQLQVLSVFSDDLLPEFFSLLRWDYIGCYRIIPVSLAYKISFQL
jgi:hypothetical protein